jgi:hypothetical protein
MEDLELERHNKQLQQSGREKLALRAKRAKLNRKIGRGDEPPESDLNRLAQAVYKGRNDVNGYDLLEAIPTISVYKKIADNTVVIAVRGSADLQDWQTNAQLPINNLVNTTRYQTDKEFVMNALQKYGKGNDVYITGHSLGGMVAEQLKRDFEQIKSGITFNPAFESKDLLNREESTVKRRYTAEDPLGIVGRNIKGAEVEDNRNYLEKKKDDLLNYLNPFQSSFIGRKLKGHKLTEFESRKGGMNNLKLKHILAVTEKEKKKTKKDIIDKANDDKFNEYLKMIYEEDDNNKWIKKYEDVLKKAVKKSPVYDEMINDKSGGTFGIYSIPFIQWLFGSFISYIKIFVKAFSGRYSQKDMDQELDDNLSDPISDIQKDIYNLLKEKEGKTIDIVEKRISKVKGGEKPDGYALHAIIIKKKAYNKNDAEVEASKFKTEKGIFMRETKLSYRFRNIPKTKFEPKSYRTKKINKDISLIYGKLK